MSFFVFHNARVPRKCGRFLKSVMKEPMMLREQGSMPKERHAYIAWGDKDYSTSSSSQEGSEEANLCLMAGCESSSSNQVSSLDKNYYNQLLHDFEELHNEAKKIFALNNRLKGLNNWLEKKVNHLEK